MTERDASPRPRSRARNTLFRLAGLAIATIAASLLALGGLVAVEWAAVQQDVEAARDLDTSWHDPNTRFDSEIGWVPIPSRSVKKDWGTVETNSLGFRSPAPRPGATSIAILGDSVTWGYGVDSAIPFPSRLDVALAPSGRQVFNLGVSGYGIDQSLLWFERTGDAIPRLTDVVLAICAQNDFADTQSNTRYGRRKPLFRLDASGSAAVLHDVAPIARYSLRHAYTDSRFLRGALSRVAGLDGFVRARMGDLLLDRTETDGVIGLLLTRLRLETSKRGAKLHVLLLPSRDDLGKETDDYRLLRDRAQQAGLPPIEVLNALRGTRRIPRGLQRSEYLFIDPMHLQPFAHTLVAAELESVFGNEPGHRVPRRSQSR